MLSFIRAFLRISQFSFCMVTFTYVLVSLLLCTVQLFIKIAAYCMHYSLVTSLLTFSMGCWASKQPDTAVVYD